MAKPADTCMRCGLTKFIVSRPGLQLSSCAAEGSMDADEVIACRNRELSNVRALLRSQTRKVEMALEYITPICEPEAERAKELLLQVLEALS